MTAVLPPAWHECGTPEDIRDGELSRAVSRAEAGLYSGQQMSFATESAAIELTTATGKGPCGHVDPYGRCGARYHSTDCLHQVSVDWSASAPPPSTGRASLSNMADRMALDMTRRSIVDDPDDEDLAAYPVPRATVELAHELAVSWGLFGDAPTGPPAAADLLRAPAAPVTAYAALHDEVTFDDPAPRPPGGYPGIKELRARMGI